MTQLTTKVDKIIFNDLKSLQDIVRKFHTVLQDTREKDIPYVAYIIDVAVNYIEKNHKDLSKNWKSWAVFVIRNRFLRGKLKRDIDIPTVIDKFLMFHNTDYDEYCKDTVAVSDYDRDRGFVTLYENKIGK